MSVQAPVAPAFAAQERSMVHSRSWSEISQRCVKTPRDGSQSFRAVARQCFNAHVPGYTGFIPSRMAESVSYQSQKRCADASLEKQVANRERRSTVGAQPEMSPAVARMEARRSTIQAMERECLQKAMGPPKARHSRANAPCQVRLVREYWVPPVPGYTGYVVGKHAENVMGGNLGFCAREAARAIHERPTRLHPTEEQHEPELVGALASPKQIEKGMKQVGEHCDRLIPGYMGHVPMLRREPAFGGTWRATCDVTKELYKTRPRLDLDNTGFLSG